MLDSDRRKPITAYELVAREFGFELGLVWKAWNRGHEHHRITYFGPAIPRIIRRLREVRAQNEFLRNLGGNVAAAFELEARGRALLEAGVPTPAFNLALAAARDVQAKDEHGFYK
jgi:hypothetical protein